MIVIKTDKGAALYDEDKNYILPMSFTSPTGAQTFLDACERTGVTLWAGMPHAELQTLYRLWWDAYKRPTGTVAVEPVKVAS